MVHSNSNRKRLKKSPLKDRCGGPANQDTGGCKIQQHAENHISESNIFGERPPALARLAPPSGSAQVCVNTMVREQAPSQNCRGCVWRKKKQKTNKLICYFNFYYLSSFEIDTEYVHRGRDGTVSRHKAEPADSEGTVFLENGIFVR